MQQTHFKFIKYTWLWLTISAITILIGVGAMVYNEVNNGYALRWGMDFTGGSLMEFRFEGQTDSPSLANAINEAFPESVEQITVTGEGTYNVQAKDMTEEQLKAIGASIGSKIGKYEMLRFQTIGPKVGNTLKTKALTALVIALIAIVFYLAYAFRNVPKRVSPWKFGVCAVVSLAHDVITTVGVFALLDYEINALFITALLTLIGFSNHDTIVVYDRIRENLKHQSRAQSFGEIADISLNQTLSRSINTSLSTIFPLVALYFFGAESLKHFVFALIFGILIGTYSSIFIASPLLTMWQERGRKTQG